jgi:Transport and Golgi organisation 2
MCTLTFIPKEKGFLVGMNRDESMKREMALPPRVFAEDGMQAIYPREASGGTWIACNSGGTLLALLNWYSVASELSAENARSRGTLIPELIGEMESDCVRCALEKVDLRSVRPFRLIGVFGNEEAIRELRWDGARLKTLEKEWKAGHWFSSSLSDRKAEQGRGEVCCCAWKEPDAGSEEWLRSLHQSHVPGPGPFSVCVHRLDAATVSYTEVSRRDGLVTMNYVAGNPCLKDEFDATLTLPLTNEARI